MKRFRNIENCSALTAQGTVNPLCLKTAGHGHATRVFQRQRVLAHNRRCTSLSSLSSIETTRRLGFSA
jgi:hypothetical protein